MDGHAGKFTALGLSEGEKAMIANYKAVPFLVELPTEVLQLISGHLTASEWPRGPCLTCRLLCYLELPNLSLYPDTDVSGMDNVKRCPANIPSNIGTPCSESCGLAAIRVGRALLWTGRRTEGSKVFLVLGMTKHQGFDEEAAAQKCTLKTELLDAFPQFGHTNILDTRSTGQWHDIFIHTNALGFHDQLWLYRGIGAVKHCELGRWVDARLESLPALSGTDTPQQQQQQPRQQSAGVLDIS